MASARDRVLTLLALALASATASGQALEVETVLADLDRPVGVAVRPIAKQGEPVEFVIAEAGARRLVVVDLDKPERAPVLFAELPDAADDGASDWNDHPLSLTFLDARTLLIGLGAPDRAKRLVLVYRLNNGPLVGDTGTVRATLRQRVRERLSDDDARLAGGYASITANRRYVYFAMRAEDGRGRLLRARHTAGMLSALRTLETAAETVGDAGPTAVTISDDGYLVAACPVVEDAGEGSAGQLVFADPEPNNRNSEPSSFPFGLSGVTALEYGPELRPVERRLYALVRGDQDPAVDGLYRLDATYVEGASGVAATKVVDIARPTGMTFSFDGALYVTTSGDGDSPSGSLVRVTGDF